MTEEDYLHGRAIEMIMCDFFLDLPALRARFGEPAETMVPRIAEAAEKFTPFVTVDADGSMSIAKEGRALARMIARLFDAYETPEARYSQAS